MSSRTSIPYERFSEGSSTHIPSLPCDTKFSCHPFGGLWRPLEWKQREAKKDEKGKGCYKILIWIPKGAAKPYWKNEERMNKRAGLRRKDEGRQINWLFPNATLLKSLSCIKINQYGSRKAEQRQEETLTNQNTGSESLCLFVHFKTIILRSCDQAPSCLRLPLIIWKKKYSSFSLSLSLTFSLSLCPFEHSCPGWEGGEKQPPVLSAELRHRVLPLLFWERVWWCCRYCLCCLCCEIHANWIRSCSSECILPARIVLFSSLPPIQTDNPPDSKKKEHVHTQLCIRQERREGNTRVMWRIRAEKGGLNLILWPQRQ